MRTWARAALGSAAAIVVYSASGAAQSFPSSRLVYVRGKGTERCPDESVVRVEVTRRLGYDPFFPWAERTIVVRITREARALVALIELLDAKGNVTGARTLREVNDCEELVRSIALAISIGLDPEATSTPPLDRGDAAPAPSPAAPPSPTSTSPATPATKREHAEPPERIGHAPHAIVEGGLWVGAGWAPSIVVGASVGAGAAVGPLSISLEGRAHLPGHREGVAVDVLAAVVAPCFSGPIVFACALGAAGRIRAQGARDEAARFIGFGGRLGVRWPVFARTSARVFFDGVVPYDRTSVETNSEPVWRLPPIAGSLVIDLASSLW